MNKQERDELQDAFNAGHEAGFIAAAKLAKEHYMWIANWSTEHRKEAFADAARFAEQLKRIPVKLRELDKEELNED